VLGIVGIVLPIHEIIEIDAHEPCGDDFVSRSTPSMHVSTHFMRQAQASGKVRAKFENQEAVFHVAEIWHDESMGCWPGQTHTVAGLFFTACFHYL
jgi:hypothetical protein